MKKITLLFTAIIFSVNGFSQAPAIQWQHSYGGTLDDYTAPVRQTLDGGYVLAGGTYSNDGDVIGNHSTSGDIWIIKIDSVGSLQWQKCLGGTNYEDGAYPKTTANVIQQTTDGGFIVAGVCYSSDGDVSGNHGDSDMWVLKLDGSGNVQWQKSLGGSLDDYGDAVIQTSDGGYVVAGYCGSSGGDVAGNHGGYDCWLVKLNSMGMIQWQKCLGGLSEDYAMGIEQTNDGGYVVGGYTDSFDGDVVGNHGLYDYWIVKTDSAGSIQWQKCLGGSADDFGFDIHQTFDGGYIVAGGASSTDGDISSPLGQTDCWVVKLNAAGNIVWEKSLGSPVSEGIYGIELTSDSGYVLACESWGNGGDVTGHHNGSDYWIAKINSGGTIQWQKSLGGSGDDFGFCAHQTTDGGYIISGMSDSNDGDVTGNHGDSDAWIVKLSQLTGIDEETATTVINLFPNPAFNQLIIDNGELKIKEIEIYNTLGEKRLTPTLSKGEGVRVDVSSLPAGVYFVAVTVDKGNKITKKFIKM